MKFFNFNKKQKNFVVIMFTTSSFEDILASQLAYGGGNCDTDRIKLASQLAYGRGHCDTDRIKLASQLADHIAWNDDHANLIRSYWSTDFYRGLSREDKEACIEHSFKERSWYGVRFI